MSNKRVSDMTDDEIREMAGERRIAALDAVRDATGIYDSADPPAPTPDTED